MIAAVHDGDTADFAAALAAALAGGTILNIPAYVAVQCHDRPHYRDSLIGDADALDRTELHSICGGRSDLGPPPVIPVSTDIPTLVPAGQFDPHAVPSVSRHVARLIGAHAHWVEFPLIGHNLGHFSPCAAIVMAFIDRPDQAPEMSCAQRPTPVQFDRISPWPSVDPP